jgi:hypothetical protein
VWRLLEVIPPVVGPPVFYFLLSSSPLDGDGTYIYIPTYIYRLSVTVSPGGPGFSISHQIDRRLMLVDTCVRDENS